VISPHKLAFLAFILVILSACGDTPGWGVTWHGVDYPTDAGAPARRLESWSHIGITIRHESFEALEARDAYALTLAPGDSRGRGCVITMPYSWQVSVEDYDRLLAHELRHCTGQRHRVVISAGKVVSVWRP
jgi:hypothetical protein